MSIDAGRKETPDLEQLRERVRADRRATSAPLLIFGLVTVAFAATGWLWGNYVPAPLYWPLAGVVALVMLWCHGRLWAVRHGVGQGRQSLPVIAALIVAVSVLFFTAWWFVAFRPLLWPTAVLLAVAVRQHNQILARWAGGAAVVTTVIWLYSAFAPGRDATHGSLGLEYGFVLPVLLGAAGLILAVAGVVLRGRERGAA
jgi:hypothetical protein